MAGVHNSAKSSAVTSKFQMTEGRQKASSRTHRYDAPLYISGSLNHATNSSIFNNVKWLEDNKQLLEEAVKGSDRGLFQRL